MSEVSSTVVVYWLACFLGMLVVQNIRWAFAYYILVMPGTLFHELCHWIVAFVLRGRPSGFSLMLKKAPDGRYVLGEVRFIPGQLNTASIALAPLLMVPVWTLILPAMASNIPQSFVLGLLGAIVAYSGFPSSQDWKVALSRPLGFLPLLLLGAFIYRFIIASV